MTDEDKRAALVQATAERHAVAAISVCEGLEQLCDARVLIAVYMTRVARLVATLRKHDLLEPDFAEGLAKQLVIECNNDENADGTDRKVH